MGKTGVPGSFEELVLLSILRVGKGAYAVSIRRELARCTETEVASGSVYATLDRIERKGWAESTLLEADGGVGRPRRVYTVSTEGRRVLAASRELREVMWDGLTLDRDAQPT